MDSNDTSEVKEVVEVKEAVEVAEAAAVEGGEGVRADEVAGGAGECATTYTIGTPGFSVTGPVQGANFVISAYDGAVDAVSHVIERVASAIKQ